MGLEHRLAMFIDLENPSKIHKGFITLDAVSLFIKSGEFLSLLGSSGSSKIAPLMVLPGFGRQTRLQATGQANRLEHSSVAVRPRALSPWGNHYSGVFESPGYEKHALRAGAQGNSFCTGHYPQDRQFSPRGLRSRDSSKPYTSSPALACAEAIRRPSFGPSNRSVL